MNIFFEVVVGHDIPDAVAGEHDELVALAPLSHVALGLGRDELLARPASLHILVLEVAQGTRHRQRAVDTLDHHTAAGVLDTLALARIYWLVVVGAEHALAAADQNGARVTAIDQIGVRGRDETGDRCGAALVLASIEFGQLTDLVVQVEEALAHRLEQTALVSLRVLRKVERIDALVRFTRAR